MYRNLPFNFILFLIKTNPSYGYQLDIYDNAKIRIHIWAWVFSLFRSGLFWKCYFDFKIAIVYTHIIHLLLLMLFRCKSIKSLIYFKFDDNTSIIYIFNFQNKISASITLNLDLYSKQST